MQYGCQKSNTVGKMHQILFSELKLSFFCLIKLTFLHFQLDLCGYNMNIKCLNGLKVMVIIIYFYDDQKFSTLQHQNDAMYDLTAEINFYSHFN